MTDSGFTARHIGPSQAAQQHMLASLGYTSLDELTEAALPAWHASPPSSACPRRCPRPRHWPSCAGWPAGTSC